MSQSILVTGATGRLGRLVVRKLLDLGEPVRAFTRRPEIAASLFGARVEIAAGEFSDAESLSRALTSIDRLVLLSPVGERLTHHQIAVIEAAERAGVRRIIKISGSNWTIDPPGHSISGAAHAEVERRLSQSPIESVTLRPNAWMQVSLQNHVARVKAGQPLRAPNRDARISYIDARDISDVAVNQLLAARLDATPLVLTGPRPVSIDEIAAFAERSVGRRVAIGGEPPRPNPAPSFEERAVAEFATLIGRGHAAPPTDTVSRVLGRPPRTVEAYLTEQLGVAA